MFNDLFPKVLIYVDKVVPPGNTFQGVLIVDQRDEAAENLIIARVGVLLSDKETDSIGLRLFDGRIHERRDPVDGFSQTSFNIYDLNLQLDRILSPLDRGQRSPMEMPLQPLRETIRSRFAQGMDAIPERLELHRRFSLPFAPLVFALLGIAIVLTRNPSARGRSQGVASCVAWLFAYYALLSVGTAMGENGKLPPWLALWLPNIAVGLISIYLFLGTFRESPLEMRPRSWIRVLGRRRPSRQAAAK